MKVRTKRVYEPPAEGDGTRVLVDRVWPRGLSKEEAAVDVWLQSAAPSSALRRWFGHDPGRWSEFRRRYRAELRERETALRELLDEVDLRRPITLLFGARDEEHNNAVVLRQFLEEREDELKAGAGR